MKHYLQNNQIILLLIAILCVSLAGCGPEKTRETVVNTFLSKERAEVSITENKKDVDGCEFIKKVKSYSLWGGGVQDEALEKVISEMTHDAFQAGANTVLITEKSQGMSVSAAGEAYRCKKPK